MENTFGIENEKIDSALKGNFYIIKNDTKIKPIGFIALAFIPQVNEFVITYGTVPENSGFVFVKDFEKTWDIK